MKPNIVKIQDPSGEASAEILTTQGFNCFKLTLASPRGPVDVLWATADHHTGGGRASSSGIPILFPFPGRIAKGTFSWGGIDYTLEGNDGMGNAIHGFVHTRPWKVDALQPDKVTASFASRDYRDELKDKWPTEFIIRATYAIEASRLVTSYTVENPSDTPLPFGLGLHPYFRTGLTGDSDEPVERHADQVQPDVSVTVPAHRQWELKDLIPTGRSVELGLDSPLRQGEAFVDMNYDDVFSGMLAAGGVSQSTVDFRGSHRLIVESASEFDVCVVYTPSHREAVCIEPYSSLPNLFASDSENENHGPTILPPHESLTFRVEYRITELPAP